MKTLSTNQIGEVLSKIPNFLETFNYLETIGIELEDSQYIDLVEAVLKDIPANQFAISQKPIEIVKTKIVYINNPLAKKGKRLRLTTNKEYNYVQKYLDLVETEHVSLKNAKKEINFPGSVEYLRTCIHKYSDYLSTR